MSPHLAKALSHPLRIEVLHRLTEGTMSSNQLSETLDQNLSKVAYHVKVLRDAGFLRQVRTKKKRGAIETFYEATPVAGCMPTVLDAKGREEIEAILDSTRSKISAVHGRSTKRLAKANGQGSPTTVVVASVTAPRPTQ